MLKAIAFPLASCAGIVGVIALIARVNSDKGEGSRQSRPAPVTCTEKVEPSRGRSRLR